MISSADRHVDLLHNWRKGSVYLPGQGLTGFHVCPAPVACVHDVESRTGSVSSLFLPVACPR